MKRLILKLVVAVVVIPGAIALLSIRAALPNVQEASTLNLIYDLEKALRQLGSDVRTTDSDWSPPAETTDLLLALDGNNPWKRDYLPAVPSELIQPEGLLDAFANPILLTLSDSEHRIRSSGSDGILHTEDDLTIENVRAYFAPYGIKLFPDSS